MEEYYLGWIEQVERALSRWGSVSVSIEPRLVVVTGMGGSGVVGDYVEVLSSLKEGSLPVLVVKDHSLPGYIGGNDLVFVVSYSGNTVETLRVFYRLVEKTRNIVVVTSNGVLMEEARKRNLPVLEVIKGIAPRTALPEMLLNILGVLDTSGYTIVSKEEAVGLKKFLEDSMSDAMDKAYSLALDIHSLSKNLVIATHSPLQVLAVRGKNEFNENSKIPVKVEVIPEWAHNDIVGWEKPLTRDWCVLLIVDPDDRIGSRLAGFMEEYYRSRGFTILKLLLKGTTMIEKLLYGSLVLGLASVKLARLRGLDPLATESIAMYKRVVKELIRD